MDVRLTAVGKAPWNRTGKIRGPVIGYLQVAENGVRIDDRQQLPLGD